MDLAYVVGDATAPLGHGPKIIVHVCNDVGAWGRGFVVALSKRWRAPEEAYRRWFREGGPEPFELGRVQLVEVEEALWVANLIGQHGVRGRGERPPVRYDAIRAGLACVREHAHSRGAWVHMPRIGSGLAGGSWEANAPLIEEELTRKGVAVTGYDLPR